MRSVATRFRDPSQKADGVFLALQPVCALVDHLSTSCEASKTRPDTYIGLTSNVRNRFEVHNSGGSQYTAALRPWDLVAVIAFNKESSAVAFEKYLKSGSGRAFEKRHFS